ncbi:two-component system sensor histidine kinase RstB [Kushneria sinocarnis]|uniref:histidine kinase n=1 Tax=Kushneria sinocarnis TaxID=595502 RepID=A0A420WTL6_9GAMM|nr:ATP-binding protein [Kushneria sinocarnis]RKQ96861.1 two-component system sensor histidine kinase RstB [Kushneria sinocarnis]
MSRASTGGVFLRVYIALVAALLLILAVGLFGISMVNDWRAAQYRERLAEAPMALLTALVAAQPEERRNAWLEQEQDRTGMGLALTDTEMLALGYWERRQLDHGDVVTRPASGDSGWRLFRRMPDSDTLLVAHFTGLSERQPQQLMLMLRQWLNAVPEDQREARFQTLRDQTALTMGIGSGSPAGLSSSQLEQLDAGQVVMNVEPERPSLALYTRLADGRWITVGPVRPFEPLPVVSIGAVMVVMLMLMGIIVYLLVRGVESRLRHMEQAASRFAAGDFDARVEARGSDYLGQFGAAFNSMAAQVQAVLSAQQEMMRAVSHEFRTPVARIRFALQMVEDMSDSPTIRRQLGEVDRDIESIDRLIDEILAYARLDSATETGLMFEPTATALMPLAEQVVDSLAPMYPALEITVKGEPADAVVDARYIQRALQNLVANACHHARRRVTVTLLNEEDSVMFDVEDDGQGVPRRDRERIFKPFTRLDDSRTRRGERQGGYGLGLAIVARVAQWHQGQVAIDTSTTLGGARFSLVLPIQHRAADSPE